MRQLCGKSGLTFVAMFLLFVGSRRDASADIVVDYNVGYNQALSNLFGQDKSGYSESNNQDLRPTNSAELILIGTTNVSNYAGSGTTSLTASLHTLAVSTSVTSTSSPTYSLNSYGYGQIQFHVTVDSFFQVTDTYHWTGVNFANGYGFNVPTGFSTLYDRTVNQDVAYRANAGGTTTAIVELFAGHSYQLEAEAGINQDITGRYPPGVSSASDSILITASSVPEPSSFVLVALGLIAIGAHCRTSILSCLWLVKTLR